METTRLLAQRDREELRTGQSSPIELRQLSSSALARSHGGLPSAASSSHDSGTGTVSQRTPAASIITHSRPSLDRSAAAPHESSKANDSGTAPSSTSPRCSAEYEQEASLNHVSTLSVSPNHSDDVIVTTEHSHEPETYLTLSAIAPVYWTSVWLRRRTLVAMEVLFISLVISLVIVWSTNRSQHGFRLVLSRNHYAWTYGPTAVLVVVLSLWRQIDYHCKLMQPWLELRKGLVDADNSMLLDYLSPLHVTSLVRAIRRRHAPVAASIIGFVLIKAVMIFSTGMLILAPTSLTDSLPLALNTSFNDSLIWDAISGPDVEFDVVGNSMPLYIGMSQSPVNAYVKSLRDGTLETQYVTRNILGNSVFQTFESTAGPGNLVRTAQNVSVDVEAFVPNVSCEIAKPTLRIRHSNTSSDADDADVLAQLESTTCSVGGDHRTDMRLQTWSSGPGDSYVIPSPNYNIWRVNCSETGDVGDATTSFDADTLPHFRYALLVSSKYLRLGLVRNDTSQHTIDTPDAAAVICKTDYAMCRSLLSHNYVDDKFSLRHLDRIPAIRNLTGMMLGEMAFSAISGATGFQNDTMFGVSYDQPLFSVLPQALGENTSTARLMSSEELSVSASRVFEGVSLHIIQQYFLKAAEIETNGTAIFLEDRLVLGAVSFWLMLLGFSSMIILTACIAFTIPHDVVSQDPGLIINDVAILSSSTALEKLLGGCHDMRTSQMTDALRSTKFSTAVDTTFSIAFTREETSGKIKSPKVKADPWLPLPAKYPMICLTLILPLAAIIVLEVLYRVSARKKGFADVTGFEATAEYLSRYGSALVVLLIVTCVNGLDFAIAVFAPYSRLQSGLLPANSWVVFRIIGSLPPVALIRSVQSRHASSFLSNPAGMVGSVLTIIASGLWLVDRAVLVEHSVVASLSSQWDIEWFNSSASGDAGAAIVFNQIQHDSASIPSSIIEAANFVLPDITDIRYPSGGTVAPARADMPMSQNFTFQVDVLRPLLSCEIINDDHIKVDYELDYIDYDTQSLLVRVFPSLPDGCQLGGMLSRPDQDYYSFGGNAIQNLSENMTFMGRFLDLHLGPQTMGASSDQAGTPWSTPDAQDTGDNPAGCPSVGAYLGAFSNQNTSNHTVTAVICSQKMQTTRANITYTGSDLMHPGSIVAPASSEMAGFARNLTNGTKGMDTFSYRIQSYFDTWGSVSSLAAGSGFADGIFDVFMNHVVLGSDNHIYGQDDYPSGLRNMLGEENRDAFIARLTDVYTRYMRLVIHKRFRKPVDPKNAATISGTAYSLSSRIKVNHVSKIVMQAMLGAITLLGLLAFLLTDLRGTLPRKPTSIASRMALVAGSDICAEHKHLLPPGTIWKPEKDLAKLFDGWLFSLGWWKKTRDPSISQSEGEQDDQRFGIDVGRPEQLGFRRRKRRLSL